MTKDNLLHDYVLSELCSRVKIDISERDYNKQTHTFISLSSQDDWYRLQIDNMFAQLSLYKLPDDDHSLIGKHVLNIKNPYEPNALQPIVDHLIRQKQDTN